MKILLATINARYAHTSLGLRYIYSNLGELKAHAEIMEFTLEHRPIDIVEQLLAKAPTYIGLSVYIWNVDLTTQVVKLLKLLRPDIPVILGGPEVSYEQDVNPVCDKADYIISGWGEVSFAQLIRNLEAKRPPIDKVIQGIQPPLDEIVFPYDAYSDHDLAHRVLYVEASRGCPFKCEFCISSLDKSVWEFNLERFLAEMEKLYQRGARTFKFVDRTFNIKIEHSLRILQFFLNKIEQYPEDPVFAHFELVPDYLADSLKETIAKFPAGTLQFELGVQTLNKETQRLISRRTHLGKAKENLQWLNNHSNVHLHVDLIAGLPGEDLASFAQGFNELWSWQPQEIQLGILKRLRGTPIIRHTESFDYRFDPHPPYLVLQNKDLSFDELQKLNRMARFWDQIANSGRFKHSLDFILSDLPFERMWQLSDWLFNYFGQTHKISLDRLMKAVFEWLTEQHPNEKEQIIALLSDDFKATGMQGWPAFLGKAPEGWRPEIKSKTGGKQRQERHQV